MMGRKRFEAKLFHSLSLAKLVAEGHLLRGLEETIDLSFVRDYCQGNLAPDVNTLRQGPSTIRTVRK